MRRIASTQDFLRKDLKCASLKIMVPRNEDVHEALQNKNSRLRIKIGGDQKFLKTIKRFGEMGRTHKAVRARNAAIEEFDTRKELQWPFGGGKCVSRAEIISDCPRRVTDSQDNSQGQGR